MDGLFYRVNENHELCAWFPKSGNVAEIFYPNVAKNKILIRKKNHRHSEIIWRYFRSSRATNAKEKTFSML